MNRRCISLYSTGLDSLLAVKTLEAQGIEVIPVYFATPFFGFHALRNPDLFIEAHANKYGIRPTVIDYTDAFIPILMHPAHGYGKHMNPCIDCKIGMLKQAKNLLKDFDASFIVTGEVLGQRPMSQRRDTMDVIIKESGLSDILLRPLCAKHLKETMPERTGIVEREKLLAFTGRGRKEQRSLAEHFGIAKEDIPTPAGGCSLTYEQIAIKVKNTIERFIPEVPSLYDFMLDVVGRKFMIDTHTVLVLARNEQENDDIAGMKYPGNIFLKIADVPGPLGVIRGNITKSNLELASGIALRYSKAKGQEGCPALFGDDPLDMKESFPSSVLSEEECKRFQACSER
jgi:tRNA U34 2-thiouridine synthase MnmA/TrmU